MFKRVFFIVFIMTIFTACSKKIIITTYSNAIIPLSHLKEVNINIEGSNKFIEQMRNTLPSQFNGNEILQYNPHSKYILHIIENTIKTTSRTYDTQEKKAVQYVDYVFNKQQNKTIPIVRTTDIIYFQRCLVTSYTLSASVTTRYKRETISATSQDKKCIQNRFNLFNTNALYPTNSIYFYDQLIKKLSLNIKNYLIPYKTSYSVPINDNIDVKLSQKDEKNYENIIAMLGDGIYSKEMLQQLNKLNNKYPQSYSLNYNIGVINEYIGQNKQALQYYQNCLDIKTTKNIILRIQTVKNNIANKKKIKL